MKIKDKEQYPLPEVGDIVAVVVGSPGPDISTCEVIDVFAEKDYFKVYDFDFKVEFDVKVTSKWWYDNQYVVANDLWVKFGQAIDNFQMPEDTHPLIGKAMLDALVHKHEELSKKLFELRSKRYRK